MVSINKIINLTNISTQQKGVQRIVKKNAPVLSTLAVLAGAGMGGATGCAPRTEDVVEHVSGWDLGDPLLDQLAYNAGQVKEVISDGINSAFDGAANIALDGAAVVIDGLDTISDSVTDITANVVDKILDCVG